MEKNFWRPPWTRIDEGRQKELDPNFLFLFQLFSDECFVEATEKFVVAFVSSTNLSQLICD